MTYVLIDTLEAKRGWTIENFRLEIGPEGFYHCLVDLVNGGIHLPHPVPLVLDMLNQGVLVPEAEFNSVVAEILKKRKLRIIDGYDGDNKGPEGIT